MKNQRAVQRTSKVHTKYQVSLMEVQIVRGFFYLTIPNSNLFEKNFLRQEDSQISNYVIGTIKMTI